METVCVFVPLVSRLIVIEHRMVDQKFKKKMRTKSHHTGVVRLTIASGGSGIVISSLVVLFSRTT